MAKSNTPEVPDDIQSRRPTPLTQDAADSLGEDYHPSKNKPFPKHKEDDSPDPLANNPNPLKGKSKEEIEEIRARLYTEEKAPVMDPTLGDLTPEFKTWLRKTHPEDYAVRYAYRVLNNIP